MHKKIDKLITQTIDSIEIYYLFIHLFKAISLLKIGTKRSNYTYISLTLSILFHFAASTIKSKMISVNKILRLKTSLIVKLAPYSLRFQIKLNE